MDAAEFGQRLQESGVKVRFLELAHRNIVPDLVQLRREGATNLILDLGHHLARSFFGEALKAGLVTAESTFVLTDLDFLSVDLSEVRSTGVQVLGLSLVDADSVTQVAGETGLSPRHAAILRRRHRAALLHDGLRLLATAMADMTEGEEGKDLVTPRVSCNDRGAPYTMGNDIMQALLNVSMEKRTVQCGFLKLVLSLAPPPPRRSRNANGRKRGKGGTGGPTNAGAIIIREAL